MAARSYCIATMLKKLTTATIVFMYVQGLYEGFFLLDFFEVMKYVRKLRLKILEFFRGEKLWCVAVRSYCTTIMLENLIVVAIVYRSTVPLFFSSFTFSCLPTTIYVSHLFPFPFLFFFPEKYVPHLFFFPCSFVSKL